MYDYSGILDVGPFKGPNTSRYTCIAVYKFRLNIWFKRNPLFSKWYVECKRKTFKYIKVQQVVMHLNALILYHITAQFIDIKKFW